MISLSVFASGGGALYQHTRPSPELLLNHMFTLCCLSWISFLPPFLSTAPSRAPPFP